jgi:hypothetical protein
MMCMGYIHMVQPLSSLSTCVSSRAHLNVFLSLISPILRNFGSKPNFKTKFDRNVVQLYTAFRKFYGLYNDLICPYNLSLGHMLSDMFHTNR